MINARKYLEGIADAEKRISLKQQQVLTLRETLVNLSAPMDKEQVSHTRNVSVMSNTIARIVDMEREIDEQTAQLYVQKNYLFSLFDRMKPDYAIILSERYLEGKKIKAMHEARHMTERHLLRLLAEAIQELQALLDMECSLVQGLPKV